MSAEEIVTDALQTPVNANAQAEQDAKKMLEELSAEQGSADITLKPENNGAAAQNTSESQDETENAGKPQDQSAPREDRRQTRSDKNDRGNRRGDRRGGRGGRSDRGGRGGRTSHRDNIKSVLDDQEKSSDHDAIRKQVEFYFSDSNLPMDKFLLEQVGGSKNNPVDLSIICSFKRMRRFEPREAVVEALKNSEIIQLVENDTKVQRKQPLPTTFDNGIDYDALRVYEDKSLPRSVYVKGFGEEKPSTQFDIEAWFAQFGPTRAIRLRRNDEKFFKRSVFAEFETEEIAKQFLALDPKPKFDGQDMIVMSKKDYCEQKIEDIKAGKIPANKNRDVQRYKGEKASRGGRGGRGGRTRGDDRDWRERREEDRKNGFQDDKKRGNRRAGQDKAGADSTTDESKADLEKVKAAVQAEEAKSAAGTAQPADEVEQSAGLKRGREAEEGIATDGPPVKKVDAKE